MTLHAPQPSFVLMLRLEQRGGWKACGSGRASPATTICGCVFAQADRLQRQTRKHDVGGGDEERNAADQPIGIAGKRLQGLSGKIDHEQATFLL